MKVRCLAFILVLLPATAARAQELTSPTAVFVMKGDGSEVRKVAQAEGYFDHGCPRWSHDGKRLAFHAAQGRGGPRACFVVNVDGTGLAEICKGRVPDWSPDDKQIAFQSDGSGDIYVQNLDGKSRVEMAAGHGPRWSPDGGRLALSDRRILRVKDLVTGDETALFDQPQREVFDGFAWSPDGKRIAVVARPADGGPRHLFIVDADGGTKSLEPRLTNEMGGFISFSPDGKRLLFANEWQIHLVDVDASAPPQKLPGQEGQSRHPAFSPDGKSIAFVSTRETQTALPTRPAMPTAKILEELRQHDRRSVVWSVEFTPDGGKAVLGGAGGNGVQAWDLTSGETRDFGGTGMLVQMFPDGRRFATSWVQPTAHVVDFQTGDVLREFDHGSRIWAFALSPDGRKLLTGGLDKIIRIWNVETGESLVNFDAQPDYILLAAFSTDSKKVITANHDKTLRVFDAATGKEQLSIEHPEAPWALAVSPDGRHVLTGTGGSLVGSLTGLNVGEGQDNVLRMWDIETGKLVRELKGHTGGVFSADVSPDGRLAVTGSTDSTMRLWDLTTGEELSMIGPGKGLVACVRFSPDGKLVFAGGGINRVAGRTVEFPNEQVRVYKVLDASEPAATNKKAE